MFTNLYVSLHEGCLVGATLYATVLIVQGHFIKKTDITLGLMCDY